MRNVYVRIGRLLYPVLLPFIQAVIRRTERVYVAVIYEKQVILVKNWLARDTWRLPGGGIGKNETPQSAAVREVKEELRLVLSESQLVKISTGVMKTDNLNYQFTSYAYVMSTFPRRLEDKYEIVDYRLTDNPPESTQKEVLDLIEEMKKQKLL